ncbi:DIP1984 family protein [Xanthomarina sp. F2636L]|uniref:DIP1984 family protein n=1 Tax=Xanthomarina sp. F2636L TaxID=2996018 RepID=UPI00225E0AAA|nr:DIP1984 family protein [Xanthomarina sp. F2636L]MCX7550295.1 DIP1984 family protein [Xanthomarina sp. F2636L]
MEDDNKKMKLAEALLLRADLMKKIEHLQNRIRPVLIVSDDKKPQEDPSKLLAQLRKAIQDLETLVIRINKTNNETQIKGEGSLMEALAKRDSLKMLSEKLRHIRFSAQINNSGEANLKTTIDIKKLQAEMDQTGRAFRELDSKVQEINWLTELKK